MIQRHHLVGEIRNNDAGASGVIIVSRIHAHACARDAIFIERDSGRHAPFGKRPVLIVDVELVRLGVIGEQEIGPAIAVVIERGHAESF